MTESNSERPKLLRSIVLVLLLLGVGLALAGILIAVRVEPPRREVAALPPLVESVVVRSEDVVEHFVGYGTVRPLRRANVAAEVSSTVIERVNDIREGSSVAEGQALIRLDDRQYRHLHDRARALADAEQATLEELEGDARNLKQLIGTAQQELSVAENEKTRVADLFERNLAAKKEYDFANLAYQQARRVLQGYEREFAKIRPRRARLAASVRGYEADAALAQLNIERCEIKAPFAGRIQSLRVDAGDHVVPGSVVLTLIDSSRVEIPIQLPASLYGRVRVGAECRISPESGVGSNGRGIVARIAPAADARTRTFAVYVVVDNRHSSAESTDLVPGTFVRAEVRGPTHQNAIVVPRRACRGGRVFIAEDKIARARAVAVQRFIDDRALVTGDLQSGDRVILSHLERLTDGSPVRVRPVLSAATAPQPSPRAKRLESSP